MSQTLPTQPNKEDTDTLLSSVNFNTLTYSKNDDTSTLLDSFFKVNDSQIPDLFNHKSTNKENIGDNIKIKKTLLKKDTSRFKKIKESKRNPTTKKILIDLRDERRMSSSLCKSQSSIMSSSKLLGLNSLNSLNSMNSLNSLNSLNSSTFECSKVVSSRIRVFSRIKPDINSFFSKQNCEIIDNKIKIEGSLFHFDKVFLQSSSQQKIFDDVGIKSIDDVFEGYNSTIFVYGQTGSGKTFTMFGGQKQNRGIVPRAIENIFKRISSSSYQYSIKASMVQIYKENLSDLFAIENNGDLKMKDCKDGLVIENLTQIDISNQKTLQGLIDYGHKSRKVSSTKLNQHSSRSHTIIILNVQSNIEGKTRKGKLYLVDLAGSQKVSKSGAQGQTLEQAKKINLSLSCLGNVINALISRSKRQHIPYRDSKLTRVLQESLGGNCITSIIVNMSEKVDCYDESLSTLKFAQRVSKVKKTVSLNNSVTDIKSVGKLHEIIINLQNQLKCTKQELDRYKLSQSTVENLTSRLAAIPSQRANVQAQLINYNSKKNIKVPKMKLSININDFSIMNTTNNDDRLSSSLLSPSLSSLSFNKSPGLSRDNSLNFSIKPQQGILDNLSLSMDMTNSKFNQNH